MTKFTRFKMLLMALVMLVGSGNVVGQTTIVGWDFNGLSAYGASPLTPTTSAANVTLVGLTRGSGFLTSGTAAGNAWGGVGVNETSELNAISGNDYATFSITANSGYDVSLTSINAYNIRRSSTGSTTGQWQYQIGSGSFVDIGTDITWGSTTTSAGNTKPAIDLSAIPALQNVAAGTTITIRCVVWGATASTGTWYLNNFQTGNDFVVTGTVNVVGGTPVVSTPTFSPAAGTYYSTQSVSLSSTTDGATIYYTTDGSDPDNTDTQYTTPISVSTTTTIKAIAYKTDMDPSTIATAVYTFPTINNVSNISTLRGGATDGTVYKLTGEALLTLQSTGTGKPKYIQDATGGILVYDSGAKIATTYNIGDGITNIIGTLTTSTGMLQFIPVADPGAATSTGNTLTPVEIDLANLANYPGQLVKVSGVTITGTGNFVASTNYNLNSSATTILRTQYSDLNYIGQPIPTVPQDIVGVVLMYNTTAELVPRSLSDFSNTVFASPTIIVSEATVPAMTAQVGATDAETITVNAQNLTANISLEVTGTNASLFTLSTNSIAPASGTVTDQSVTITYTPTAAGSHTATLTLSSTGAESVVKTLSGSATWPPLAAPVAIDASGIGQNGFTANWEVVSGATSYELSVYTKQESTVNASDLFISEYIEGSSNNKAIEIYNGTGSSVDLSAYSVETYTNGGVSAAYNLTLSGTLANNDVYVIYNSGANATIVAAGDVASTVTYYNGDDAVVLKKNGTIIDIFGRIGEDPGTAWTSGEYSTVEKTLRRKSTVSGGVATNPESGFPTLTTEWDVYPQDNADNLGAHTYAGIGYVKTQVSGSPFTVTGETSKAITGLSASTTYYYTVVAKNANVDSNASNEISVVTSFGTGVDAPVLKNITAFDGKIRFSATAGQLVEVYNAVGQKLMSATTLDGLNTLNVNAKGMMIVKVGDRLAKVIL